MTVPSKRRILFFNGYLLFVSSSFRPINFLHALAIRFSISVSCVLSKLTLRPRYLAEPDSGKISICMPPHVVWVSLLLPVRRVVLLRILVLSGCSSRPLWRAALPKSCSIFLSCEREVATSRTSSAKRKFVRIAFWVCPSCSPQAFFFHVAWTSRMASSSNALNKQGLSGSPCLVPLSMLKLLLCLSVLTYASWLVYSCFSNAI